MPTSQGSWKKLAPPVYKLNFKMVASLYKSWSKSESLTKQNINTITIYWYNFRKYL
jgi:hypothetical protein